MNSAGARFAGVVYRAHHPGWAHAPLSGDGARLHGGRFNRPGRSALYLSLSPETAWLEAQQAFVFKAQPMTLCAYQVDCADVIDLSTAVARAGAGVALETMACAWEDLASRRLPVPSWALAERMRADGAAGLLAPSFANGARDRDVNLVLFSWSTAPPHAIRVIDDFHRLPRDGSSWS